MLRTHKIAPYGSSSLRSFRSAPKVAVTALRSLLLLPLILLWAGTVAFAQSVILVPTIQTIAGTGTSGAGGIGGPGTSTQLNNPLSAVMDHAGNVYFADYYNNRVVKIDAVTGKSSVFAGNGTGGYTGDGGPATQAELNTPGGLVADAAGNIYIGDSSNNVVRKVDTNGVITTFATAGTVNGKTVNFQYTDGLGIDGAGNIYVADRSGYRVWKISTSGSITAIAGNGTRGYSGDNGAATSAMIGWNWSAAVDANGNVYIADYDAQRVRRIDGKSGIITTIAGTGTAGYNGDNIQGTKARINLGVGAAVDVDQAGNVYLSDEDNCRIREIVVATGIIRTVAGTGTCGYAGDGGPATSAQFYNPQRINYVARDNSFIIADTANNVMRQYRAGPALFPNTNVGSTSSTVYVGLQTTANVSISSIAVPASEDGKQEFNITGITGCTVDGSTVVPANSICKLAITFSPGFAGQRTLPIIVTTSADKTEFQLTGLGLGSQVSLISGPISTIAGTGTAGRTGDGGAATSGTTNGPRRGAADPQGNLYFADYNNNTVRRVDASTGVITTIAGTGTACASSTAACGDGAAATAAQLNQPSGVALDGAGHIFIADSTDNRIRRVDLSTGLITTVAGTGTAGYSGDNGAATSATLNSPTGVAVDQYDNLYIVEQGNNVVRQVNAATGYIQTIIGNGTACNNATAKCGDGAAATSANLNAPTGVAVDASLNVYVADTGDNRVRVLTQSNGQVNTLAGTGAAAYGGDNGAATSATLNGPRDIAVDPAHNVYIADTQNNVVRVVASGSGTIFTYAGINGAACAPSTATCGDGGAATAANLNVPRGLFLDSDLNLYITDTGDNRVRKVNDRTAAYSFAATQLGNTSSDSAKTLTLLSSGDTTLNFPIPANGNDPSISSSFTLGNGSSCPQLSSTSSSGGTLSVGTTCTYQISFSPMAVGSISGSMVITDDSSSGTTQTVSLSGTGLKGNSSQTLTSSNQSPQYGQQVTLTDTLPAVAGVTPTGTVTFYNGTTSLGTGMINSAGVATLNVSNLPIGTDTVSASYPGDSNFNASNSNNVTETVSKVASSSTLTSSNLTPNAGQSVTFTDTISQVNGVVPVGTVTFFNGNTQIGTGTLSSSGVATLTTSTLPAGASNITAQFAGDTTYGPTTSNAVTETVAKNSGSNTLSTSNASPNFGQQVTLTDTLAAVNGITPTGTVTFSNGSTVLGTATLSNGVATLNTSTLPIGSDKITAAYNGDSSNNTSTSNTVTETVGKANDTGTLTTSNANPAFGSSVTLTDTLTAVNGVIPTGTVTFYNGSTSLGTGNVNSQGVATLTTSALPVGTDSVTAQYGGDTTYNSNTSAAVTETVSKGTIAATLTTSAASTTYGQSVTLTDTLGSINGVIPTGTITFMSGSTVLGTGTLNASGVATLATSALPAGTDSVTAVFNGDTNYNVNTSNAVTETVAKATGTNTLSTSNANPTFGQSVTLTDTLSLVNGAAPTGTVTFMNGSTVLGTANVDNTGKATLTTTSLPVGTDTVSAQYGGDTNNNATTSNNVTETVGKGSAGGTLTTSNASPSFGTSVTLTDTLAPINGVIPTGTVNFYNGTSLIGTGTVDSTGKATLTTGALPVGTDSITAQYGGDSNYTNSTTSAVTETVSKSSGTGTLTTSNANPNYGGSVTLTDTLSLVNGTAPTGTVTFYNGTTSIGTGTVNSSGVATLTTSSLPVGTDSITAQYPGDSNYTNNTSNAVTETVARAAGTNVLSTSNASPNYGQPVTLTATLGTVNGTTPTGTVTFYNGSTSLGQAAVNSQGVATLTTSALPVGTDSVTEQYGGDSNYAPSTSNAVTETVGKAAGSGTLSSSNTTPNYGQSVTLTETLAVVNGVAPTGTVTFYNGSTSIGTGTVNSSGVATLTTSALPVGSDNITAQYPGDGNYANSTSNVVTETVGKGTATGALTSSPSTANAGQTVTLTDTLPATNGTVPTGTVTFYNGNTVIGTGTVNSSGVATMTSSTLPVGSDNITAVYGGDSNYAQSTSNATTVTITRNTTANTLSSSNTTPSYGASVTFTDTIAAANGLKPTGTVTFLNGSTVLGTGTLSSTGVATFSTSALPVGTATITASYGGDTNFAASSSNTVTETVGKSQAATTLTTSNASPSYGQSVTFTDTLPLVNGTAPTGTVTFYNGSTVLGTSSISSGGVATLVTAALPVGTDSVTAQYAGDSNYAGSTSNAVTETVGKNGAAGTLSSSNTSPSTGQSVTFTDTLPAVNGATPTGTVTFYNGNTSIGTGTVNSSGVATLTTGTLPAGTDTITAVYGGDSNYAQSTSNAVTETVSKSTSTGTLATSNATPSYGQSVTFTDTLPAVNGLTPTGTVTFYNGNTSIGTANVNSSGVATLVTSTLPVGTDSITASYGGDANFAQSTSNVVTETVGKNAAAATLTASNTSPAYGQSITLTDTLPVVNGVAPTGNVNFYNGNTLIGTGTVNASGVATLTTGSLPVGADAITAVYAGDGNYAQSTSNAVTVNVGKDNQAGTLSTSNASPNAGQSVALTDTLPVVNGTAPTGTVTFYNGSTVIGTGTVNGAGVATLTTSSLPAGTDSITAVYPGDSNYSNNTSNAVTETVGKNTAGSTLSSSNTAPAFGDSVTLTDTLAAVNGLTPTGTVTFYNGTTSLGTGTVNSSGVATLTTSTLPVGSDPITAVYGGDSNFGTANSNVVTENVGKGGKSATLTTSNASPTYGDSVTLTDTLPVINGTAPTGTVTFYNGNTSLGTGTVNSSGVATLMTSTLPVGTDTVTAVYAGDTNYSGNTSNAVTETVAKGSQAGTLSSSNTAPTFGTSVTFTDTLPVTNGTAPTGTVTFFNGTTSIGTGTLNASGVATFSTASLPVGTDNITASFPGDANYAASTSNVVTETVARSSSAGTLTASNNAPNYGQSITLTDTFPAVNGVTPSGSVTFYNGSAVLGTGTISSTGVATITTGSLPAGSDAITAVYAGDSDFGGSTAGPLTVTVGKASLTNTLSSSDTAPNVGQTVTLTATLTGGSNGMAPTGSVTFYNGSTSLGMGTVNTSGVATLSTTALPLGTDTVTAVYGGDSSYGNVTSNAVTITVSKNTGSGSLTTSNPAPTFGQSVTFTDTLPVKNGTAPTGTVTFFNASTSLGTGTLDANGVATLTTSALPVGTDSVTAQYGGDSNYSSVTSNVVTETVGKTSGTNTLTSSNTSPAAGQPVTFTDQLQMVNGVAPTGSVTFYSGSTALGTGTINSAGIATYTTSALAVGTESVTAVYGGDGNYSNSTSNAVSETVGKNSGAGTLTTSTTSATYGQSVTLTDTLPAANGLMPTGSVTFYSGNTAIGTGAVNSSGVATLATSSLPVGTDTVTAVYGGDTNFGNSTSNAVQVTVAKSGATGTLTSSLNTPTVGQTITLTDTLPVVNGVVPTGSVNFYNGSTLIGTGTVNSAGVATLTTGSLPVGTDTITATYGGDANYSNGNSNALTITVGKSSQTSTLTTSNATPTFGDSVTLTDTVASISGTAPTGSVTFYNGTTSIGSANVNGNGVATLTTATLPVGTDQISAVYAGDSNYSNSTSNNVTETVAKPTQAGTLTVSNNAPAAGQPITLTDTLPVINGIAPTGTVSFYNGTTFLGTGTVNGAGVATFTTGTLPVGSDSITAVYGGDSNYGNNTSNAVVVTVAKSSQAGVLTTSDSTPTFGESVTLTDTLPVVNGTAPTGSVTFYNGTTNLGTGVISNAGVATLTTSALPPGTDTVTAVYAGDSNYSNNTSNAVVETVAKSSTPGVLTTSNASPSVGQSITLTDTLTVVNGVIPTGTVVFYNGSAAIGTGTVNASGVATLTLATLPVGTDTITANYSGDANYANNVSNSVTETVGKDAGQSVLTSSSSAINFGQSVTLTDTLSSVNGETPTGSVTFYNGTTSLGTGTISSSGVATLSTTALAVGTANVTAVYGGDNNFAQETSNQVAIAVSKGTATGVLSSSNTTPTYGQAVTLTNTLPAVNGSTPTGSVVFYAGTTNLGTGLVNSAGVASLTTASLPLGTSSVTAVYGGDSTFGSSTSNAVTETVTKGTGTGTLTASNTAPSAGQSVTLTDTLPTANGIVPTGTVTFYNGSTVLGTGTVNANGVATLTTGSLPAGTDTITASYGGDGSYGGGTSNAVIVTVAKNASAQTLTSSSTTPASGEPITLTDTLAPANGLTPGGTVTFYNGSTVLGTATVNSSGVATLLTSALPSGANTVTAQYGGDSNFSAGTSSPLTITVAKGTAIGTLTASDNSPTAGESITLTDTLPQQNGLVPTGTVTFYNGSTAIGTGTVNSSGVATILTGALPVGATSFTAVYSGDSNYSAGSAGPLALTVAKAATSNTLTTSNATPNSGQAVTFTATLPAVNGLTPTGTVSFLNGATTLGTGTLNASGIATFTTSALPAGTDTITAAYAGDTSFKASTSNAITETVGKGAGTGTLSATPTSSTFGQTVTLTDTLPSTNGLIATGTVTFYNGTTAIGMGSVNASGVATLTTGTLPAGTDTLTAAYGGDTNYAAGTSNAVSVTVAQNNDTATLAASTTNASFGQQVTLTTTLSSVNGVAPTGTVTFLNGTTAIGTGVLNASGVATLTTGSLPVGADAITASYPGDTNYAAANSNVVTVIVAKSTAATTLTTSNPSPSVGQQITLTDTLTLNGTIAPTGAVTFLNGSTVLGTANINSSGVATLLTSSLPAGTDTVTAMFAGDSSYGSSTSNAVTETVTRIIGTATLTSSDATPATGEAVTLTVTIPTQNGIAPTGTVDFFSNGHLIGSSTLNSNGVVTLVTSTLPTGNDQITANYSGDTNYFPISPTPLTLAVGKASGSDVLAVSNNAPTVGQAVTFTATLASVNGTVPTGTVTFVNGTTTLGIGTLSSSGVATLTTSALPVGTASVTASYAGDTNFAASTSNVVSVTVAKTAATGTLTTSNPSPTFGQSITLTDTLPLGSGTAPTGTVSFYNGTVLLGTGTVNAAGVATLTTGTLPAGTDTLTAVYGGDTNYASGSSNAIMMTVGKNTPAATLATNNTTPTFGQSVTLTTTLTNVSGTAPTGPVTFLNGTNVLGTANVNSSGVATLSTSALPAGTDTVTASYGGDANYAAATSNAVTETVSKPTNSGTLTTSNPTPTFGQAVTLTDTLPIVNSTYPTGTVTFYAGTSVLGTGTVNTSGIATLSTSTLSVGVANVTAVYSGDTNFDQATSNAVAETIGKASPAGVLTTSNATPAAGGTVTLTLTMPATNNTTPTGTVTFYTGTTALGTGTLSSAGVATLTTSALPVGTSSVTAAFAGDANFANTTSNAVAEDVTPTVATVALTATPTSANQGQAVTLTATVPAVNGTSPTGTVTFLNGTMPVGTGTLSAAGVATFSTTALPTGVNVITAVYGGDSTFKTATSAAVQVTVVSATPTLALTSSPNPQVVGSPVALQLVLSSASGQSFSGTVTFLSGSKVLGTAAVQNNSAGMTTSTLAAGSQQMTAVFTSTDGSVKITSPAVTQSVTDFTIGTVTPVNTTSAGQSAAYTVNLGSFTGTVFGNPVVLSATGLPSGYTVSFSPGTVTPGTAGANSTMTIHVPGSTLRASRRSGPGEREALGSVAFALLLLPAVASRRMRRRIPRLVVVLLVGAIGYALTTPIMGCGGGYFGSTPSTYTVTVTGTSGTLHHATTVTLNVR